MPIYEYRCAACGHTLDALQKLNDGPLRKCPQCRKSALKRLMSAPSFRLKGGGWYETDFKSDGEKKRNLVETAASEPADTSGGKSGDATDGAGKEAKTTDKADGAPAETAKPAAKPKEAAPAKAQPPKKRAPRSARPARR